MHDNPRGTGQGVSTLSRTPIMHRPNPFLAILAGFCLTVFAFAPDTAAAQPAQVAATR